MTSRSSFMGAPPGKFLWHALASIALDELLLSPWSPAASALAQFLHTAFLPARASAARRGPLQRAGATPPAPRKAQLYVRSESPAPRMDQAWTLPTQSGGYCGADGRGIGCGRW